jgi:uncharacterized membrane protein
MQEPSKARKIVYYVNKFSWALMATGVGGIVIGAITRDNAPLALIAFMFILGIVGMGVRLISYIVWRGMDVADALKKK